MNRRTFLISTSLASVTMLCPRTVAAQPAAEFVVGQSVDLSGSLQNLGRDYFTGAKVAFDQANASGGTAGRRWRFVQLDDGGQPDQAVLNTTRLLKENRADALFGFTGDECVEAVLASAAFKASGRMLFAPMSGIGRAKDEGRALYLRATYAEEVAAMVGQFAAGRMSTFALVHGGSKISHHSRDAALRLLAERNLPQPSLLALKEDGSNAVSLATGIARFPPHAVVILADTIPAALLSRELRQRVPGLLIAVPSSVDPTALQQLLGAQGSFGLIVSRVVPNPDKGTEQVVRDFKRALARYMDEAPTAAGLEGYVAARTLIEITARSPGTIGMARGLRNMRSFDSGGFVLNFAQGERASRFVDTSMITRKGGMLG